MSQFTDAYRCVTYSGDRQTWTIIVVISHQVHQSANMVNEYTFVSFSDYISYAV